MLHTSDSTPNATRLPFPFRSILHKHTYLFSLCFLSSIILHVLAISYYDHYKWTAFSQILAHYVSIFSVNIRTSISVTEEKKEETIYHPIILSDDCRLHILLDSCYRNPTKLDTPSENPWWNKCVSTYTYTYTRVCTYTYNWTILHRNNRIVSVVGNFVRFLKTF